MQCAVVKNTTCRSWLRLLGRRHDVQRWCVDERTPRTVNLRPPYPGSLSKAEDWVQGVVASSPLQPLMCSASLRVQKDSVADSSWCILTGTLLPPTSKTGPDGKQIFVQEECLREVVVLRQPAPAVLVYNLVEYGRRWYRSLAYSWGGSSLHDLPLLTDADEASGGGACGGHLPCGSLTAYPRPAPSLLITRNLHSNIGVQTFIPDRLLRGVVPDGLLEDYEFWQHNGDENLTGYQRPHARRAAKPSLITVELEKLGKPDFTGFCCSRAAAVVRRVPIVRESAEKEIISPTPDPKYPVHTLLNVMFAAPTSELIKVRHLVQRVDSISCALTWTESDIRERPDGACVDLIEFTRLNMSFRSQVDTTCVDGRRRRFYSVEHSGFFVSNFRSQETDALLSGLRSALLLENDNHELLIMVPAGGKPTWGKGPDGVEEFFLDRSDKDWIDNLSDVRHYIYPVHNSGSFLATTTLASSLYLLLLRFLAKQYDKVVQIAESCPSDTKLSPEEQQIWDSLGAVVHNRHPDACACRLRLSLLTMGCEATMRCPWDVRADVALYIESRVHVSAACRLTREDEWELLSLCRGSLTLHMSNRMHFLQALISTPEAPVARVDYQARPRGELHFDRLLDRSCLSVDVSTPKAAGIKALLSFIAVLAKYKRPIPPATPKVPQGQLVGAAAILKLQDWLCNGLHLGGGKDRLGE